MHGGFSSLKVRFLHIRSIASIRKELSATPSCQCRTTWYLMNHSNFGYKFRRHRNYKGQNEGRLFYFKLIYAVYEDEVLLDVLASWLLVHCFVCLLIPCFSLRTRRKLRTPYRVAALRSATFFEIHYFPWDSGLNLTSLLRLRLFQKLCYFTIPRWAS